VASVLRGVDPSEYRVASHTLTAGRGCGVREEFVSDSEYETYYADLSGLRSEIARDLPVGRGMSVLDVASGYGYFAVELARREPTLKVTAVDISSECVSKARLSVTKNDLAGRVCVMRMDAADMAFDGERFDMATNFGGMEDVHMTRGRSGVRRVLLEVGRVLKRGKCFCFVVVCTDSLETEAQKIEAELYSHICGATWLKRAEYESYLEAAGLRLAMRREYSTGKKLTPDQARKEIVFACENVPRLYGVSTPEFGQVWEKFGPSIEKEGLGHYSKVTLFLSQKTGESFARRK
jgi:ubiquinone/menaquinone biosynthesis C-methylase UbiE